VERKSVASLVNSRFGLEGLALMKTVEIPADYLSFAPALSRGKYLSIHHLRGLRIGLLAASPQPG
jgi:hypothetical protein